MFKLALLILTVLAVAFKSSVALTDEQQTVVRMKMLEYGLSCFESYPVTIDDLNSFKDKQFAKGPNAKCLAACMFKKFGLMDDGGFVSPNILSKVEKVLNDQALLADLETVVNTCMSVNDAKVEEDGKGCGRAELLFNCISENAKKFDFNVDF